MKKQSYYVLLLAFASVLVSCGTTNGSKATTSSRNTPAATATSSPTITPTKMQSIKMYLNFEDPTLPLEAKEKTIQILKNRFDNCSYPTTITFENNQIIIIAPESFMDDSVTSELLLQKGDFEVRDSKDRVWLTNSNIQTSQIISMEQVQFALNLSLDESGTKQLATATTKNIGQHLSIYIDGVLYSSPVVEEALTTGSFNISGLYEEEALYLNTILSFEPLPAEIYEVSSELYDN
mgnify:CR=1 FL=1